MSLQGNNPAPVTDTAEKISVKVIHNDQVIPGHLLQLIDNSAVFRISDVYSSPVSFIEAPDHDRHRHCLLLFHLGSAPGHSLKALEQVLAIAPRVYAVAITSQAGKHLAFRCLSHGACACIAADMPPDIILSILLLVTHGYSFVPTLWAKQLGLDVTGQQQMTDRLSDRQRTILEGLANGKSYGQIAMELYLSVETIRTHIKKMYRTLDVANKAEAINLCMRERLWVFKR